MVYRKDKNCCSGPGFTGHFGDWGVGCCHSREIFEQQNLGRLCTAQSRIACMAGCLSKLITKSWNHKACKLKVLKLGISNSQLIFFKVINFFKSNNFYNPTSIELSISCIAPNVDWSLFHQLKSDLRVNKKEKLLQLHLYFCSLFSKRIICGMGTLLN